MSYTQPAERLRNFEDLRVGQKFLRLGDRAPFTKTAEHSACDASGKLTTLEFNPKVILQGDAT